MRMTCSLALQKYKGSTASLAQVQTVYQKNKTVNIICSTTYCSENVTVVNCIFSAPGKSDTALRSKVRPETKLEIAGVKVQDAGKFTCKADGKSYQHTLLVVLGEHTTQEICIF